MKRISTLSGRFALTSVAAAALWMSMPEAWAVGLGRVAVQSALGENLRAEIDVTSLTPEEASNLRVRVAPPEQFRAAGVDYNAVLPATQVTLARRADGRPYLKVTSDRAVLEPFVDVILEISWATGKLVREYTLLFDPPNMARAAPAAPTTSPVISSSPPAPQPLPATRPAPVERARPVAAAPVPPAAPKPEPTEAAKPARTASAAPADGPDSYRVRSGDSLSRIASRTQREGVSLDQMLVALYRANPQAFMGDNMNRLKAGVVLTVPDAETAKGVSVADARQVIQAQSADFGAYRQRLAGAVPMARVDAPARQASGKVQAAVEDKQQPATPSPDKLTLSKGGSTAGKASSAAEEAISKDRERQAAAARVAELARNVDELKKLSGATASAAKPGVVAAVPTPPASAPAVAAKPAPAPAPVAAAPAPAAPASAPAAAPAPAPVMAAAPAPAPVAAAPASAPVVAAAPASAVAPAPAASVAKAAAPKPAPMQVEEPGFLGSLLDDNPLALALGGGLVALLAGFGVYRFTKRSKKDSGETSFLESRLQPDSFFGASGGQRIDTRDAGGASSSMSYSLSQLDAIGDVDPVAEADVYLAYGRDLQAEEILKEAMRGNPDRMAIRTKLLEVYAKRRDTKGFELLATQLFSLTRGEGDDWAKAQEMGQQIDPENPLYQPGGAPVAGISASGQMIEPLGASTMPQSVLPSPSQFRSTLAAPQAVDSGSMDLDLDLGEPSAPAPLEATQAFPPPAAAGRDDLSLDFSATDLTPPEPAAPAPPPAAADDQSVEFDLGGISLDLDLPQDSVASRSSSGDTGPGDFDLPSLDGEDNPLSRKLELAEEFRQIGDLEGARDLLEEVVAKAEGGLKSKAQGMLDDLG